ncbi:MAG: alpha/beta hydrolase [Betaproteobacteria bacterium]|nr:alpha/beta hydrolase [Betaproteobacteria bacterium]
MPGFRRLGVAAVRRIGRFGIRTAALAASIAAAMVIGFTLYAVSALPPLQPWHIERLDGEFDALFDRDLDFAGYLHLEKELFAELERTVAAWPDGGEAFAASRFNRKGTVARLAAGAPWNRSFRLARKGARGQALLVHGLTDSPYSMKALAESLHRRGFDVTVLRLPGHGTLPSMMTTMRLSDWQAAVRIAARDVAGRAGNQPFYIGGYSTGGTLALLHALESLGDASPRRPDRVLLVSPAIELTPVAALASIIDALSIVPVPVLEKVRWQEIAPEFDPYKFNSFPVNAARQVNRATSALQAALAGARESGRIAALPPVVAWQSVVDSTVGATGVADRLFAHLAGPQHRLVVFDVNRSEALASVQRPRTAELLDRLTAGPRNYTLEVISNAGTGTAEPEIRRFAPDGSEAAHAGGIAWPPALVSLGHVALPFPPDDPVYGIAPGSGHAGIPSLGSWLLRGESGAITLSLGALTRPRSNPFWPLIDSDVGELVASDLAGR